MRPLPGGSSIWGISLIAEGRIQTNLSVKGKVRNMWTWTIVDANGNTSEPTNCSRKMVSFTTVSICSTSHFFQNDFKSGKATTYEYPRDNFKCNAFATFDLFQVFRVDRSREG